MTNTAHVCSQYSITSKSISTSDSKKSIINTIKSISALCSIVLLSACGGSDETDTETYIKLYNASPDSPSIYMTLDEDSDGILN